MDVHAPSSIRLDEVTLRPPRTLGDGTRVYDAVLVRAGQPLQYGWGTETPTASALSDPAYLSGLHGVSVVLHHPPGGHVHADRAPRGKGRRIGTVVGARYDATEAAVIVELAVHESADQAEVERLGAVSEAYHAATVPAGPGVTTQVARQPNSVAVTGDPRAQGASIRTDEANMEPEKKPQFDAQDALNMIKAADARADAEKARADKAEAEMAKMNEAKAKADADAAKAEGEKTKAEEQRIDSLANERAAALLTLQRRADSLEVKIPDTLVTLSERTAHVATELGCPKGTDPAAFIAGVEKSRADAKGTTDAERFTRSAKRADEGADTPRWIC